MKKVKIGIWVVIVGFVAILIYQNRAFFVNTKQALSLNLLFDAYKTPELVIFYICFAFFGAGLLLGLYFLLLNHLRLKKAQKSMSNTIREQQEKLASLQPVQPAAVANTVATPDADSSKDDQTVVIQSQTTPQSR